MWVDRLPNYEIETVENILACLSRQYEVVEIAGIENLTQRKATLDRKN